MRRKEHRIAICHKPGLMPLCACTRASMRPRTTHAWPAALRFTRKVDAWPAALGSTREAKTRLDKTHCAPMRIKADACRYLNRKKKIFTGIKPEDYFVVSMEVSDETFLAWGALGERGDGCRMPCIDVA
eukprot:363791-Chlamydomonas_euryale.AAC.8